ncbi:hypothetical protein E4U43_000117 [Claviceps pusilla]|uniref:Uncharacterized protein n=1 Tax=Claviceps pusilla TaxID=123648 RepID=A0A9P7NAI5_9HYPO|nr:hypothetical protein E4U43_000117 [Claviceps pusilla]
MSTRSNIGSASVRHRRILTVEELTVEEPNQEKTKRGSSWFSAWLLVYCAPYQEQQQQGQLVSRHR